MVFRWDWACLLSVEVCQLAVWAPIMVSAGNVNVYDVRKQCKGPLCYDKFDVMDGYLNQPDVRMALGVGDRQWQVRSQPTRSFCATRFLRLVAERVQPGSVRATLYEARK